MSSTADMINELCDMFEEYTDQKTFSGLAAMVFRTRLRDGLRSEGIAEDRARYIAGAMTVELPATLHKDHPNEFNRLVDLYTKMVANAYFLYVTEFNEEAVDSAVGEIKVSFN